MKIEKPDDPYAKLEEAEEKRKQERQAEIEKRNAEKKLRKELDKLGEEHGVRLELPNVELRGLDVRDRFCQERGFMVSKHSWGKGESGKFKKEGRIRPFTSWESQSPQWHSDEEVVRSEMAKEFPDDTLYAKVIEGETFNQCQARKEKIIKNWEEMKDEVAQEIAA